MSQAQVNKNALRVIKELIAKMRNSDNWVNHGICGEVNNMMNEMFGPTMKSQVRQEIKEITQSWAHYSGDSTYPVPASIDGSDRREPGIAFTTACARHDSKEQLWSRDTSYGAARWALMRYIEDTLAERVNNAETLRYSGNEESLGDILASALRTNIHITAAEPNNTENTQMNTHIDTDTIAGKIAVMQAHERGETVEFRYKGDATWDVGTNYTWHWGSFEYRIQPKKVNKDTFDFAGLNQKWKYSARDKDGRVYLYTEHPRCDGVSYWNASMGETTCIHDMFDSYVMGDVDWQESVISRADLDTMPAIIVRFIREGQMINAIKEHRHHFGTGLREAKDACQEWREKNVPNWRELAYR